jgi:hypothetical protein
VGRPDGRRRLGGDDVKARSIVMGLILVAATHGSIPAQSDSRQRRPEIADLEIRRDGQWLDVAYRLKNGFTEELTEKIQAGIPVKFRHRVEVTVRHFMPLWPARTVATATVETSVTYDSLTHRYELSRAIEASSRGKEKSTPVTERERTVSEATMRAWMTEVAMLPPLDLSTLPEGTTARVRVETYLGRRWIVLVPTRRTVSAERKLAP